MNHKHIFTHERCCIVNFLDPRWSLREIVKHLNRNIFTIYKKIKRNSFNGNYLAYKVSENYINSRLNYIPKGKVGNSTLIEYI